MHPASPISAYKNSEENQSPPVPAVLRSRHRNHPDSDPLRRVRQLATLPTEIVIDAHKYNQQHGSLLPRRQEGIRGEIDACLTAVERVYEQQTKRRGSRTVLTELAAGQPAVSSNAIHRVDAGLILKYIGTIRQDYGLPERFGEAHRNTAIDPRSPNTHQVTRNPQERFTSTEKRGQSKRAFINMTLSTNREKRAESGTKPINSSANRGKSPSTVHSPIQSRHNKPPEVLQSPHKPATTLSYRIPEDFKFCISCEQSILSSNINYHEQHECKDLQRLYKLSFAQLRQLIAEKINNFRRTLHGNLEGLSQKKGKGELCEDVMDSIQKYLDELQGDDETRELSFLQVRDSYLRFQQTLKGDFFHSVALTHKLDYFIRVYVQLTRSGTIAHHPSPLPSHSPDPLRLLEDVNTAPVSHFQPVPHLHPEH